MDSNERTGREDTQETSKDEIVQESGSVSKDSGDTDSKELLSSESDHAPTARTMKTVAGLTFTERDPLQLLPSAGDFETGDMIGIPTHYGWRIMELVNSTSQGEHPPMSAWRFKCHLTGDGEKFKSGEEEALAEKIRSDVNKPNRAKEAVQAEGKCNICGGKLCSNKELCDMCFSDNTLLPDDGTEVGGIPVVREALKSRQNRIDELRMKIGTIQCPECANTGATGEGMLGYDLADENTLAMSCSCGHKWEVKAPLDPVGDRKRAQPPEPTEQTVSDEPEEIDMPDIGPEGPKSYKPFVTGGGGAVEQIRWWSCPACGVYIDSLVQEGGIHRIVSPERLICPRCNTKNLNTVEGDYFIDGVPKVKAKLAPTVSVDLEPHIRSSAVMFDENEDLFPVDIFKEESQWPRYLAATIAGVGSMIADRIEKLTKALVDHSDNLMEVFDDMALQIKSVGKKTSDDGPMDIHDVLQESDDMVIITRTSSRNGEIVTSKWPKDKDAPPGWEVVICDRCASPVWIDDDGNFVCRNPGCSSKNESGDAEGDEKTG